MYSETIPQKLIIIISDRERCFVEKNYYSLLRIEMKPITKQMKM